MGFGGCKVEKEVTETLKKERTIEIRESRSIRWEAGRRCWCGLLDKHLIQLPLFWPLSSSCCKRPNLAFIRKMLLGKLVNRNKIEINLVNFSLGEMNFYELVIEWICFRSLGEFDILLIWPILPGGSELCGSRLVPWVEKLLPCFLFSIWEGIVPLVAFASTCGQQRVGLNLAVSSCPWKGTLNLPEGLNRSLSEAGPELANQLR